MVRTLVQLLMIGLFGCSVGPLNVAESRSCPCAPGWLCDESQICVLSINVPDRGTPDRDSSVTLFDAQVPDAIVPDAIVPDAELVDGDLLLPDAIIPDAIIPDADIPDANIPDANIPDQGVPDQNVPDMSVPDAALPSCPSGALVCEDFETDLDGWDTWISPNSGATLTLASNRSVSGNQSLRVHSGTGSNAELRYNHQPALTSGRIYARFYIFLPSGTTDSFAILAHKQTSAPFHGMSVSTNLDRLSMSVYQSSNNGFGGYPLDSFPNDRWVCINYTVQISETGTASIRMDNESPVSMTADTLPTSGINQTTFGVTISPNKPAVTYWLDDLVLDRRALPCP